jgi:phosphate transport system protein
MTTGHIVQAYDADLNELETLILKMGSLADIQLNLSIKSLTLHDVETARTVVDGDKIMDKLELDVAAHTAEIFALRQPVAADLRSIIAALKISNDLERIGDHAKNIAKRTIKLQKMPLISRFEKTIHHIFMKLQKMMDDVLLSYVRRDADQALIILKQDEEIARL